MERKLKKLSILGEVTANRWRTVLNIVDSINNDENTTVLEKEWADEHRKNSFLDLSDRGTWSTYDQTCIDLEFSFKDKKLICDAKIYNGDAFDGARRGLKFTAKIQLQNDFVEKLDALLEYEFNHFLDRKYEEHLEQMKYEWVKKFRSDILSDRSF